MVSAVRILLTISIYLGIEIYIVVFIIYRADIIPPTANNEKNTNVIPT